MMTYSLTIVAIIEETSNTKSFLLKPVKGLLSYQPGQFLTLIHPKSPSVRRSYSLSSHPSIDEQMRITVKRIANGEYSRWLFDEARVGDRLETIGASGLFTLSSLSDDATVVFIAAGSGITPVLSLLKEVLFYRHQNVVLVCSNRSEAETIFYLELQELKRKFPQRLSLMLFFSDHKNLLFARLSSAVLGELINRHASDKTKVTAFVCGPHDYMQMATITLIAEGIPQENIRTENFNTDKPKTKDIPPDTDAHHVAITFEGKAFSLEVKYPDTILQAARHAGIELPYSCEAGRCGTCVASCPKGEIWMSRNEVLVDKEVERGRVLTCTGYPVGGDAELVIG